MCGSLECIRRAIFFPVEHKDGQWFTEEVPDKILARQCGSAELVFIMSSCSIHLQPRSHPLKEKRRARYIGLTPIPSCPSCGSVLYLSIDKRA